jgi:hypothetical protein
MDSAVAQIRALAQNANRVCRQEILSTLSKLQSELEDPMETLIRLSNFVCDALESFESLVLTSLFIQNILIAMFRIAVDVQLFQALNDNSESLDVGQGAKVTGMSSDLLGKDYSHSNRSKNWF